MNKIGIIDVGIGNSKSIENVLIREGFSCEKISDVKYLENFKKIILPGVGAFDAAMQKLNLNGFTSEIKKLASEGALILGICLGAQLLMKNSAEGKSVGLELLKGSVEAFKPSPKFRVPHMGWNSLTNVIDDQILFKIDPNERFYFSHSYYLNVENKKNILAETNYEFIFEVVIRDKNVYGVQFHPEKSHRQGVQILRNFAKINV